MVMRPCALRPLLRQWHGAHRGGADRLLHRPGMRRRFAFEKLLPFQPHVWDAIKTEAKDVQQKSAVAILAVMFRTAWSISPSAMPNAQA